MSVATAAPGAFLTLHYRLSSREGRAWVDTFDHPPATLTLGSGEFAPGLEACLIGLTEGQSARFEVDGEAVFGPRNPELVQRLSRKLMAQYGDPDHVYQVGDAIQFPAPEGAQELTGLLIAEGEDYFDFDFNHPLAGQPLVFEVRVIGIL
ncbi:FKBP-type peptidyl-prolyl cis-trans isomerase [Inhella gelatinilytica]|uniref:Peptidyl-prolyl cis-trans isomerase n=1 Tax=Inhella gelatinilytica TaxID=2795030 RepID=A0A931IZG2_9BURK|nr:FKBP-type peptidyl-prolyl cis-trans isomerase [Inhella gelatinilytica]MBH9553408.1 FKBP-type peptidyl-prolyl cis-trans isomerase [Inhella gelatinilytica]